MRLLWGVKGISPAVISDFGEFQTVHTCFIWKVYFNANGGAYGGPMRMRGLTTPHCYIQFFHFSSMSDN